MVLIDDMHHADVIQYQAKVNISEFISIGMELPQVYSTIIL